MLFAMDLPEPKPCAYEPQKNIGVVRSVEGTAAQLVAKVGGQDLPLLGEMVTLDMGRAIAIAQVTAMHNSTVTGVTEGEPGLIDIELVGELPRKEDGLFGTFRTGVSISPRLGDAAQPITHDILTAVTQQEGAEGVLLGHLHQDPTIPAFVETDEMLGKHFAIVGSTGTGKSCTVALVLRKVLAKHPNAHIVLLDPHDEYPKSFGDRAECIPIGRLNLPYWALTFEELIEVLLGDSKGQVEEAEILRECIPTAKRMFASERGEASALRRNGSGSDRFSVDIPIPYRMSDVIGLIDAEMGQLERPRELDIYRRLKARINLIANDPRFEFMFGSFAVQDNLKTLLRRLFRVPVQGKPITILNLKGLPGEIVNVVVSVLARLTFDLAIYSHGRLPITLVCEEAHRYVPANTQDGFEPTKRSIARIAREGRKYGASLCMVSQRPADLDPTILSQCSTVFAMRLSNEPDRNIIASAMADARTPLLQSLPLLSTREALVFGEAVNLPSRIVLEMLPPDALPHGGTTVFSEQWSREQTSDSVLDGVISQWRQAASGGARPDDGLERLVPQLADDDDWEADVFEPDVPSGSRPPGYGISYSGHSAPAAPAASRAPHPQQIASQAPDVFASPHPQQPVQHRQSPRNSDLISKFRS